ncbi:hypothetical protein SAPIO_CDS4166 [Scedosporium apiospermum]|uniref:Uncharacterized protein n=1 Tax=Pseudallescheria apiosperma TaxID=563466 RepID=A0A084G9E9_PSEDA|nr:uncharacterized protein SAPIO_CDS4166 [Scedosporium apiospermum]KEZ43961.1 hypothetical protein SAPIO_CDS4166 [Scedosporium apiospermum]
MTSSAKAGSATAWNNRTFVKDCAVFASDEFSPVLAAGKPLGTNLPKIGARIFSFRAADTDPWIGFVLEFPLGKSQESNDDSGFGVRYHFDRAPNAGGKDGPSGPGIRQLDMHRITVKFPRGDVAFSCHEAKPEQLAVFPNAKNVKKGLTIVSAMLRSPARVDGFGIPFANPEDQELEGWVNDNQPIVDGVSLLDFLSRDTFHFLVDYQLRETKWELREELLPPSFHYPYGDQHDWKPERYKRLLETAKSDRQFLPAYSYPDDNAHLAVVTQANIQDIFWLHLAAEEIAKRRFPAYFVPIGFAGPSDAKTFYAIVALTPQFKAKYEAPWRRLAKGGVLRVNLYGTAEQVEPEACWDAMLVEHPEGVQLLAAHPTEKYEVVLKVRRPKVGPQYAAKTPTNPEAFEAMEDMSAASMASFYERHGYRMDLHRALMRGTGFYEWMTQGGPAGGDVKGQHSIEVDDSSIINQVAEALDSRTLGKSKSGALRSLPVVNFLNIQGQKYIEALMQEVLPEDRSRLSKYLSHRALGLGMVLAGPGFGKTTVLSVATLAMQARLGPILASGPSNIAVDKFAERLDRVTNSVCDRYSKGKPHDAEGQARRRLVVRGYRLEHEYSAFLHLLEKPTDADNAAPSREWGNPSQWKLHLSVAFWALVCLRSQATENIRQLHPDDCLALHKLRLKMDKDVEYERLRAVASGGMAWEEYQGGLGPIQPHLVSHVFEWIVSHADILCTTPAMTTVGKAYPRFKGETARGVAVDEAANMNRADLACVWGNTLLPCLLGGDPRQLPPTIMTGHEKDSTGHFIHRLADDGKISPLAFFQATGMPVFRLRKQLRMAKGMFDWIAEEVYPEVKFQYGANCTINLPQFNVGRDLEAYIQARHPGVKPCPPGQLLPVFLHCQGSRVFIDDMTGSKRCPGQVKAALDFATAFVKSKKADAARLAIIAPYAANVQLVGQMVKHPEYSALRAMPPASTVDGYQGGEADIVIVVMGTTSASGPGFTSDAQRLNVMFTRQRCGLVIVGDLYVCGPVDKPNFSRKVKLVDYDGHETWTTATLLRKMYNRLYKAGRVVRVSSTI